MSATNVIFRRSRNTGKLRVKEKYAVEETKPFLDEVIGEVNPKVILFVSKKAYDLFTQHHCIHSTVQEAS